MGPSRETRRARISRPIVWAGARLRTGASPPRTGRRYGYGIKANTDWKATLGEHWRQYEETFPALARSRIGQVSLECRNARVPIELIGLLKGKDVLVGCIDVATSRPTGFSRAPTAEWRRWRLKSPTPSSRRWRRGPSWRARRCEAPPEYLRPPGESEKKRQSLMIIRKLCYSAAVVGSGIAVRRSADAAAV
jgi:hypothetical protein